MFSGSDVFSVMYESLVRMSLVRHPFYLNIVKSILLFFWPRVENYAF